MITEDKLHELVNEMSISCHRLISERSHPVQEGRDHPKIEGQPECEDVGGIGLADAVGKFRRDHPERMPQDFPKGLKKPLTGQQRLVDRLTEIIDVMEKTLDGVELQTTSHPINYDALEKLDVDIKDYPASTTGARRFVLHRYEDETGVSGTGIVAEGVEFTDGMCALSWKTSLHSIGIYHNIKTIEGIHGHNGRTQVEYVD